MDTLSIALCISIGSCVAWLVALLHARRHLVAAVERSVRDGRRGAVRAGDRLAAPWLGIAGLVIVGPFGALLAILDGGAILRALRRPTPPARS